ncbi:MAG: putative Fe-S protein YdhL (DUF1289 family) [Cellvibrionaceae bacterium]|jgi:predicted Fe-S protein YdhL (DUF1289 family)
MSVGGNYKKGAAAVLPVASPCISICALDDDDICAGCYRSADEIRLWGLMTNDERRETNQKAYAREKRVNPFL